MNKIITCNTVLNCTCQILLSPLTMTKMVAAWSSVWALHCLVGLVELLEFAGHVQLVGNVGLVGHVGHVHIGFVGLVGHVGLVGDVGHVHIGFVGLVGHVGLVGDVGHVGNEQKVAEFTVDIALASLGPILVKHL